MFLDANASHAGTLQRNKNNALYIHFFVLLLKQDLFSADANNVLDSL